MSYSVDVYRDRISPERHLGNFALYLAFFPKLIAGPIERGANLLPQFWRKHHLDLVRISSGAQLMGWGFFKKLVIADRLAIYVDMVFRHPQEYSGKTLIRLLLRQHILTKKVQLEHNYFLIKKVNFKLMQTKMRMH